MGCTFQSHHLDHLVGCEVGQCLDLRKETAATDIKLFGKEIDVQLRIGEIFFYQLVHTLQEFIVSRILCNLSDRLEWLG